MKRARLRTGVACAALGLAISGTTAAQQNPHPTPLAGGPSSLPAGTATIRGVLLDASDPENTRDLPVALYALQPDGTPGIGSTKTESDGSFEFTSISNDPAIVYLVGVRYAEVPYGERTSFVAGQDEIDLVIPVTRPTADSSGVRVIDSTIRIEALGARLAVEEVHTVANDLPAPVFIAEAARTGARVPFRATLPDGALDFQTGVFGNTGAFEQRDGEVLYWGPLYSGEQELRFSYQLAVASGASSVTLESRFPLGTGRVRVLTPEHGPEIESDALRSGPPIEIDGATHALLEADAQTAGAGIAMTIRVPETRNDTAALTLGPAEVAVELDDTVLEVTQSQQIQVQPGAPVAGTPTQPLLRFELPLRSELVGLSTDAGRLGIRASQQGIEVMGPLGPGTHDFAFSYRLPASEAGTTLDLRFPLTVPRLLLRAADTGLVLESDRLHRLRPEAMGTRTWMLREAFHLEPDEVVSVRFVPLDRRGPPQLATVSFMLAAAAVVLLFVVAPLRRSRSVGGREADERQGSAHQRDLIYATIRDLEHDFETGKVAEADYERSRQELRARAIELMREEQRTLPQPAEAVPEAETGAPETGARTSGASAKPSATGGFCPACGRAIDPAWRFCSHCGGTLKPAGSSHEPAG
jgi:hypothetical protein